MGSPQTWRLKSIKPTGTVPLKQSKTTPTNLPGTSTVLGFKTADKIAQDLGLAPDHPSRVEAGIIYTLNEMNADGHVYAPQDELTRRSTELLDVVPALIPPALERLTQEDRIRPEILPPPVKILHQEEGAGIDAVRIAEPQEPYGDPVIYLTPFYFSEKGVSERLGKLAYTMPSRLNDIPPAFVSIDPQLSDEQAAAIRSALSHPVSVLTGGPGTGKTTCLKALINILESASKRYALASPTGRAAKRLSEATDALPAPSIACWDSPPSKGSNTTLRTPC